MDKMREIIFVYPENLLDLLVHCEIDQLEKSKKDMLRQIEKDLLKQSDKESVGSLLDALIPEDEIPNEQTILKPTEAKKIESRFELVESKSAFNHFAKQHTIEGIEGILPEEFLEIVKPYILDFLEDNPDIKIQADLTCIMAKTILATGVTEQIPAHFLSKQEINFRGTDKDELFANMSKKILESLASFQQRGSN